MITIVEGNILDAPEHIIGQQVNCQKVMGSGLAKQIREKYPIVYEKYLNYFNGISPHDLMGRVQIVTVGTQKFVANIFGQLNYGRTKYRYTDYYSLDKALSELKSQASYFGLTIALPYKIGCGLANGDWDGVVYPMLQEIFSDYDITLYKWEG